MQESEIRELMVLLGTSWHSFRRLFWVSLRANVANWYGLQDGEMYFAGARVPANNRAGWGPTSQQIFEYTRDFNLFRTGDILPMKAAWQAICHRKYLFGE